MHYQCFWNQNISIKNIGVYHYDVYYYYVYVDELDSERTLMPDYPATLPIILHPPPRGSTEARGIQILPTKQILQRSLILLA